MRSCPRRTTFSKFRPAGLLVVIAALAAAALMVSGQELRNTDKTRGRTMLRVLKKDLLKYYYDPTFHGVDVEARFAKAEADLEQATSVGHMFGIIAQAVVDLGDSHTRFLPPSRTAQFEYGWRLRVIGEIPYIVAVKPGSDAEAKGLKIGDRLLAVDGNAPTRQNASIFTYRYFVVRPVTQMRLTVQSPGGAPRQIEVATKVEMGKKFKDYTDGEDYYDLLREIQNLSEKHRFAESAEGDVMIWNIPTFDEYGAELKAKAAKMLNYKSVVIDLRGNPGGYEESLTCLLGHFFDHDVTVGQLVGRGKPKKPVVAKTQGERAFRGNLIVLIDSDSGSAAELFARVIQLEKRGVVIGDRSAGAVMRSIVYTRQTAGEYVLIYGIAITMNDLIMADGKSLEGEGVIPDELVLPTGADLAAGMDPVLVRAVELAGGKIAPADAGKAFPYVWRER